MRRSYLSHFCGNGGAEHEQTAAQQQKPQTVAEGLVERLVFTFIYNALVNFALRALRVAEGLGDAACCGGYLRAGAAADGVQRDARYGRHAHRLAACHAAGITAA